MKKIFKTLFPFLFTFLFLFSFFNFFTKPAFASSEKVIYLTFDDGPSKIPCTQILDILKAQNVKGTFFILGNEIKGNEDILKRIADEGHALGLHSMTHDRNNLYSNDKNFLKEMLDLQILIKDITGVQSNILRFPFGANNNTYSLKKSLVTLLHENNLKIYDWTLDSKDGEFFSAPPSTFINASKSKEDNITLLMHCGTVNKNSPKALSDIITYYKDNGYTFKIIDETTPEIYHFK
ncbi:MAG: polysaccharide deacetylase family protein [Clostridium sp.]|uniref:polysaccharide deacetylase family protein n=1 Tax=Clostridium sp. TaxID=1506 RepID=UPI003F3CE992